MYEHIIIEPALYALPVVYNGLVTLSLLEKNKKEKKQLLSEATAGLLLAASLPQAFTKNRIKPQAPTIVIE